MSANPIRLDASGKKFFVVLDERLRSLAVRRAGLDYEIGVALLEADDVGLAAKLGFGSFSAYVERVFGFGPHVTAERLRVARVLRSFPATADALREGRLGFSKVREITRILTDGNERDWLDAAPAMTAREVEERVALLGPGGKSTDRGDASLRKNIIRLELKTEDFARFRSLVDRWRGSPELPKTDAEIVLEALEALDAAGDPDDGGRAPSQTFYTRCVDCEQTFVDSRGDRIEVGAAAAERVGCDTQVVGDLDKGVGPARARQTIRPAVRRQVRRRSGGRCEVPGCRSRHGLEIHHIQLVSEGGSDDPANLVDLCSAHHGRFHEGLLRIEGTRKTGLRFLHADGTPIGRAPSAEVVLVAKNAYDALRAWRFSDAEARRAIGSVLTREGELPLEAFVKAALRELRPGDGDGSGKVSESESPYRLKPSWRPTWDADGIAETGSSPKLFLQFQLAELSRNEPLRREEWRQGSRTSWYSGRP